MRATIGSWNCINETYYLCLIVVDPTKRHIDLTFTSHLRQLSVDRDLLGELTRAFYSDQTSYGCGVSGKKFYIVR